MNKDEGKRPQASKVGQAKAGATGAQAARAAKGGKAGAAASGIGGGARTASKPDVTGPTPRGSIKSQASV